MSKKTAVAKQEKVVEEVVNQVSAATGVALVQPNMDSEYVGTVRISSFNYDTKLYVRLYLWLYMSVIKDYKFRKRKIGFRFEDGTVVTMKVRTAIVNLIFWKPYCDFNKPITQSTLFDTKYVSDDTIANRLDEIIAEFKGYGVTIEQMCKVVRHIIESLSSISVNFCVKIGNTINMCDIIDLADRHPQFNEILHTHYDEENLPSFQEIERDIMARNDIMAEIIKGDVQSAIRPFIKAGGNVNMGQMAQCLVCIGPRSDIYGNIAPVIVNTNFVLGLRNVSDYYLESYSQRKALIANRYQMCDSGYTSRQIDLSTVDSCLVDVDDCGTEETIEFFIPDKKTLTMLEYKYIETGRDKKGKPFYHEINPKTDESLIGQTVKLRSHTVCALPQGQYCKKCYGEMSYITMGFQTNLLASHSFTEPVSQTVLSTKHLNKTRTKVINWPDIIKQFFKTESEGLYMKPDFCTKDYEIGFYTEDIEEYLNMITEGGSENDEDDETEGDVMMDYVTRFVIAKDGDMVNFDNLDVELYINSEFLQKVLRSSKIENGIIFISLAGQASDEPVFDINIENIEISAYLKRVMCLLGVKSKTTYTTISDLLQRLTASVIEIGVKINFTHLESIVYNMIRDPGFIIRRPDFSKKDAAPQYVIIPTNKSIMYSRSLTTGLAFERIAQQFKDVYTYLKSDEGFLDPFFR